MLKLLNPKRKLKLLEANAFLDSWDGKINVI